MTNNRNLNYLNSIRIDTPTCNSIDTIESIDEWHASLDNDVLSLLHINIMNIETKWDLLLIKIEFVTY